MVFRPTPTVLGISKEVSRVPVALAVVTTVAFVDPPDFNEIVTELAGTQPAPPMETIWPMVPVDCPKDMVGCVTLNLAVPVRLPLSVNDTVLEPIPAVLGTVTVVAGTSPAEVRVIAT